MEIIDLKTDTKYLKEYLELCSLEWGKPCSYDELKVKVENKTNLILTGQNENIIKVLGLIEGDKMIGFIALLKDDKVDLKDCGPWYGSMYVKKEYRNKGYSKILNNAILDEARKLNYNRVYLKTTLNNYYEKMGAIYILNFFGDKIYYFDII